MGELARLVIFSFYELGGRFPRHYQIVDRNGKPWFAAKDAGKILELKNVRKIIATFPENEKSYVVCDVASSYTTSGQTRARKTQRVLIISEEGLFQLILRSRKPVAQAFKEKLITEVLPAYREHGINWASLPKIWPYRGQMLNYAEWRAKKMKKHPDATFEEFLASLH
jgi:prophage antirepressor-like protein